MRRKSLAGSSVWSNHSAQGFDRLFIPCNLLSLFSENDRLDMSQYESDDDQLNSDRLAKIREAEAEENVRLKALNLKKKMNKRLGSPLGSSRKVQSGSRPPVTDSSEPVAKKNKVSKARKNPDIRPVIGSPSVEDLGGNSFLLHSSFDDDEDDARDKVGGVDVTNKTAKPDGSSKSQQTYMIPRKEKTSAILPERFWPADMTAAQVDKLSVDQVHALKKLELEEKSLKKDTDLPGLVITPTELYLPEVTVSGGVHDFVKNIVPGSMLHFPIGPLDDWWENVAVEWKTVTGKILYACLDRF